MVFDRIELVTDGAVSDVTGMVDLGKWPEQLYHVKSRIQFPRMREIFFATNTFDLHGEGEFDGHVPSVQGRPRAEGQLLQPRGRLNFYRFPDLEGSLVWVPDRFEVTRASSRFYGGHMDFTYLMSPLNVRGQRSRSRFVVDYRDVDLLALTTLLETRGLRVSGRATGHNRLELPTGQFAEREGDGEVAVTPPPGVDVLGPRLPAGAAEAAEGRALELGPFSNHTPLGPVGIGGRLVYRLRRRSHSPRAERARRPPRPTWLRRAPPPGASARKTAVPRHEHELAGERSSAGRA